MKARMPLRQPTLQFQKMTASEKVYKVPNVTVDAIITRPKDCGGNDILLITRGRPPFVGHYAFPGGFCDYGEDPKVACLREVEEECGIKGIGEPELITVAGAPDRDPRKHVISIVYAVEIANDANVVAGDDAATARWYNLKTIWSNPSQYSFAFDHRDILELFLSKKFPSILHKI